MIIEQPKVNDKEIQDFIAHFGKKGMRWGKHTGNSKTSSKAAPTTGKQKLAILGGGLLGGAIGARLTMGAPLAVASGASGGALITHKLLTMHGNIKVSTISRG